jgi:hypothetical protein
MDAADLPAPVAAVPLVAEVAPSAEPRRVRWQPADPPPAQQPDPAEDPPADDPPADDPPAEVSPLGPSTPAGARPRFPPPPGAAAPVAEGVETTVRSAGAAAFGAPAAVAAPEPTRRRERPREEPPDGGEAGGRSRSAASTLKLLLAAVVIVVALILIAEQLFGGSSSPPRHTTHPPASATGPAPSTVTVSVLNGTHTTHLASTAWSVLSKLGYRQGALADAPSQDHSITFIAFTGANRPAAVEVAHDLGIATVHVHNTIDRASLAAATATGQAPPSVIVILGRNYASG